jgi:NADPH:quinone reductase-like Zn-dependent oxidoreductase
MKLLKRILGAVLALVLVAVVALALVLRHDSPCGPVPLIAADAARMKAIVYRCYGTARVLRLEEVAKPMPADNELLVKVHAASLNPLDWHYMTGTPYILRLDGGLGAPKDPRLGVDFAGTVEAVGKSVTRFKPGDEVFGGGDGAFAEYLTVREDRAVALKPPASSFEQAAAVPIAGLTALQALRDRGRIRPGERVLINGASGGVGTFAVQIAKSFGADVTGVCSTKNVNMVRALGADHVIDYTREDFTRGTQRYQLILDNVGSHSLTAYRRVMSPDGMLVIIGGPNSQGQYLGPVTVLLKALVLSPFTGRQRFEPFLARLNAKDLALLGELIQAGKVTPVIDRRYGLSETAAAMGYLLEGHARGKVVITLDQDDAG